MNMEHHPIVAIKNAWAMRTYRIGGKTRYRHPSTPNATNGGSNI